MARGPMALIRKYQKAILVVVGVMTIIVFTMSGMVGMMGGGGRGGADQNPTVVRWNSGELTRDQLDNMRFRRNAVLQFLYQVCYETQQRGGRPKGVNFQQDPRSGQIIHPGIPAIDSDEYIVRTLLLAEQAEAMGMVVSDDTVLDFLIQLGDREIEPHEFQTILSAALNNRLNQFQLFDGLRRELLAQKLYSLAGSGTLAPSPRSNWDFYNRLNRKITAELMPLPVADYIGRVEDPTEMELDAFFAEHKDTVDNPGDAEPGFRQRQRVAVEYLDADFNVYLDQELAKVSDAEIEAYYEENKETFKRLELPDIPGSTSDDPSGEEPAEEEPAEEEPAEEEPAEEEPAEEEPAEEEPAEEEPAEEEPAEEEPAEEEPAEEEPAEDEPAEDALPSQPSSSVDESAGEEESGDAEQPSGELTGDGEATEPVDATATDTTADATEPTADEAVVDGGEAPTADNTGTESDNASATAVDKTSVTTEVPPSYKPLEEVQDEIRRKLALPRAQQVLADRMEDARAAMELYFRKHVVWKSKPANSDRGPEPQRPDFQQLAAEYGFTPGTTPLLDPVQFLEQHDIGKSSYWDPNSFARGSFTQIAFDPSLLQFMASETRLENVTTGTEKRFLWWKIEDQEAHVPALEDVRDDVVKAWKLIETLDEAEADAESIAERLNESGQTLQEAYGTVPGKEIIKTDEFSWMTGYDLPSMNYSNVFPSQIDGVEGVTGDFLRGVFALAPQSAGWVVNGDHSIVYVVRVSTQSLDENELRDGFLVTGVNGHMQRIFQESRGRLLQDWYEGVEDELSLVWLEDPRVETRR